MSSGAPRQHVVVGIVRNPMEEILVMKRPADRHLGGLAEFPGGKLVAGESPESALQRELKEELDIDMCRCRPLIQVPYSYADREVFLDVFLVTDYSGRVRGVEGQEFGWRSPRALDSLHFPKANHGIVRALQLPGLVCVTPAAGQVRDFLRHFRDTVRQAEVGLVHFRSHDLGRQDYLQLAEDCLQECHLHRVRLVLNAEASLLEQVDAHGLHLTSRRLCAVNTRPLGKKYLVSASCHTLDEVLRASQTGLDYIFLGPVCEKVSSAPSDVLGWKQFANLARESAIPVYAIGGLGVADIEVAIAHGGQGVAAIRAVWQQDR